MRHSLTTKIVIVSLSLLALSACTKPEAKTGSLTQRFTLIDSEGRNFGRVEMDPVGGGTIIDIQGRLVGRIVPPSSMPAAVASAAPVGEPTALAPIPAGVTQ